ncbi:MAG: Nif3-like dinuclear metal center hexameric protein [Oscillospiraceae bacterium]|nr:Nif3-like dinuclear metal center hexameric protein [Oscillospiraceae bacterium]
MSIKCEDIFNCIEEFAPLQLAEPWDNSGLNLGHGDNKLNGGALLCLDVTSGAVDEACRVNANLIISHHPMIFTPVKKIDTSKPLGRLIRKLIFNDISVYCAHTNVDKTYGGLNDLLLGLLGMAPIADALSQANTVHADLNDYPGVGANTGANTDYDADPRLSPETGANVGYDADPQFFRIGVLQRDYGFEEFCGYVSSRLKLEDIMGTGSALTGWTEGRNEKLIRKVAVMCGSFDLSLDILKSENVDAVVSGEMKHHQLLELNEMGIYAVVAGHHGTERFFVNLLEKWINGKYPEIKVFKYGFEMHPLKRINVT